MAVMSTRGACSKCRLNQETTVALGFELPLTKRNGIDWFYAGGDISA
jgi:hypothetical protein